MQSDNNSVISETSSKFNEESRQKINTFLNAFEELGWDNEKDLTQDEIRFFLNNRTKEGQFDQTLASKLFSTLDIDDNNRITGEEFIKGYLQFEEDLKRNNNEFNRKFIEEQKNIQNLDEQCRLYRSEKLSPEGFCENAKITVEITDVSIERPIEGINSIVIKVIYNDEIKEIKLKIGGNNVPVNKKFEFKPTSRRDHFEFIMKKIDDQNQESDIGSKVFPLGEITSQEEYIVQITIPEIEDEEQVAAYINCKVVLFWSDYELYEEKKKKSENKLKKIRDALNKTNLYLEKMREIYGELKKNDINNNLESKNNQIISYENNSNSNNNNDDKDKLFKKNEPLRGKNSGLESIINENVNLNMIDNGNGNKTNTSNIPFKAKKAILIFGHIMILLGLVSSLKRPDFPNILGGIFVSLCSILGVELGYSTAIKWFRFTFNLVIALLIYDLIWIVTNYNIMWGNGSTGGHDNLISFLSVILCFGNIIIKALLLVLLYSQYKATKNLRQ